MAQSKFSTYGFFVYLVASLGFMIAAIIVAWPEIQSFLTDEPLATPSPDNPINKALVMSAISIYLAVRSYFYYRLKLANKP